MFQTATIKYHRKVSMTWSDWMNTKKRVIRHQQARLFVKFFSIYGINYCVYVSLTMLCCFPFAYSFHSFCICWCVLQQYELNYTDMSVWMKTENQIFDTPIYSLLQWACKFYTYTQTELYYTNALEWNFEISICRVIERTTLWFIVNLLEFRLHYDTHTHMILFKLL